MRPEPHSVCMSVGTLYVHKMKGQYTKTYAGGRVHPVKSYISETTEQVSINLVLNINITSGK
jgi:hypothetical protein